MNIPPGLRPIFKAVSLLGFAAMVVDTLMSAAFGWTIGVVPMIGLAIVSLASGLFLVVAFFFQRAGMRGMAAVAGVVWIAAFAFNVWSNMGVATSTRMGEVQRATVQQTTYGERKKAADEAEANLKLFGEQLASLLTQNAWAATVKADGLRDKSATLDKAISEEGNKRNGGCKRRCLDLMAQKAKLDEQIAVAERRRDIEGQIEATKRVLEKARTELAGTQAGISQTANQSNLYAKLISFNLADDPEASAVTVANESTGIALAIVIALISTFLTLLGAIPHLGEVTRGAVANHVKDASEAVYEAAASNVAPLRFETRRMTVGQLAGLA